MKKFAWNIKIMIRRWVKKTKEQTEKENKELYQKQIKKIKREFVKLPEKEKLKAMEKHLDILNIQIEATDNQIWVLVQQNEKFVERKKKLKELIKNEDFRGFEKEYL